MRLGVLVATMLLVTCGYVECQKASIQVDQAFGVSSFYPNSDHYKMKFAYQYGIGFGYLLTQNIEFNIGYSYQMAGAAD